MSRRLRSRILPAAIAALVVGAAACGGGSGSDAAGVEVDGAWARATAPGAVDGVAYLVVTVPEDDQLVAATVPGSVARTTTLHVTTGGEATGGGHAHHAGGDASATVSMTEIDGVDLRAGEPYAFIPGGSHVMLVGLQGPLVAGTEFPMRLVFAREKPRTVRVAVRDNPPPG